MRNDAHVEDANREADCVWDMIEGQTDEDTTYTPVTTDQVNGWYGDGLITGFEGFLLLTDRTI